MYFESFVCGPDKFILSVKFFLINGKKSFLCEGYFIFFCWVLFFIHCEYGIDCIIRSDYFGNLSKVENVVGYLFVIDQCQFLLHICILVG